MNKTNRKSIEESLEVCNKCKNLNFATKECEKDKDDPIKLNTFTNGNGFISVLRPSHCK